MSAKLGKPKPQHAPKAPHEDPKFLESTAARPLRILAEYIDPMTKLKREGIGDTIVIGTNRFAGRCAGAVAPLEKGQSGKDRAGKGKT